MDVRLVMHKIIESESNPRNLDKIMTSVYQLKGIAYGSLSKTNL